MSLTANGNVRGRRRRNPTAFHHLNKNPKIDPSNQEGGLRGDQPPNVEMDVEEINELDEQPHHEINNESNEESNFIPIINTEPNTNTEIMNDEGSENKSSESTDESNNPESKSNEKEGEPNQPEGQSSEKAGEPNKPEDKPNKSEGEFNKPEDQSSEKESQPSKPEDEPSEKGIEPNNSDGESSEKENKPSNSEGNGPNNPEGEPSNFEGGPSGNKDEFIEKSAENNQDSSSETRNEFLEEDGISDKYIEVYLNKGYATRKKGTEQYYAKDIDKNEIYFTGPVGEQIYATKLIEVGDSYQTVEYPARNEDGTVDYIYEKGNPKYPENQSTSELIFPKDPETNEEFYLTTVDGRLNDYPSNKFGRQFYRKDAHNNEIPLPNNKYAKTSDGHEIYPKLNNGDEYYLKSKDNKMEIGATTRVNDELISYYARKKNGDEIYPRLWLYEL